MGAITAEVVDTGERRDGRGRRVFPRAQRLALIEAYRGSGMSMAAFARREQINYTTLAGWLHRSGSIAASSPIRFAEVKVPTMAAPSAKSANELEVRRNSRKLWMAGWESSLGDAKPTKKCPSRTRQKESTKKMVS